MDEPGVMLAEPATIVYTFCRQCGEVYPIPEAHSAVICKRCLAPRQAKIRRDLLAKMNARSMYYPLCHNRARYNGPANEMNGYQENAYKAWEDQR